MTPKDALADGTPLSWLLIFHRQSSKEWLDRLIPGRFKHVSAVGYVAEGDVWLFYDVQFDRTLVRAVLGEAGRDACARQIAGNAVLRVAAGGPCLRPWRFGFWCVPAMKHLIGARTGALLPAHLWRDLVAQGAEIVHDDAKGRTAANPANA